MPSVTCFPQLQHNIFLATSFKCPRWWRWQEVMSSRWPLYCIFLSHGAPRQLAPAPTLSLIPWGHFNSYFFCREVELFFLPFGYSFCREVILFVASLFLLPWGYSFCLEVILFAVRLFTMVLSIFSANYIHSTDNINRQHTQVNSIKTTSNNDTKWRTTALLSLENHVLWHSTIFGIEQFPNERIYITSTQKCSYRYSY